MAYENADGTARPGNAMGNSERVTAGYSFENEDELFQESGVHLTVAEAGSTIAPLFAVSSSLAFGSTREDLLVCLQRVRTFLDAAEPLALYTDLFANPAAARALVAHVSHVEHVGLIIPQSVSRDLAWAGAMAGFRLDPTIVPSVLVARELGGLIGRESVKTTVFKVSAKDAAGDLIRFEAFIPSDVDDETVRGWIRDNVSTHVAVLVKDLASMAELEAIFASEGYTMPSFMNGKPMVNQAEQITVMYFDGAYRGRSLRIECCCYCVA
jgi:hypothetical protein